MRMLSSATTAIRISSPTAMPKILIPIVIRMVGSNRHKPRPRPSRRPTRQRRIYSDATPRWGKSSAIMYNIEIKITRYRTGPSGVAARHPALFRHFAEACDCLIQYLTPRSALLITIRDGRESAAGHLGVLMINIHDKRGRNLGFGIEVCPAVHWKSLRLLAPMRQKPLPVATGGQTAVAALTATSLLRTTSRQ